MTWSTFHRRAEVLRAVVTAAETRRDGVLPTDVPGVDAVFADDRDLLGALQLSWHTRLMGRIERHQMDQPGSLEDAVVAAWHDTVGQLGGVRLVLDAARDHAEPSVRDAMARAAAKERQTLAVAAGLGNPGDAASVRVGGEIERRARESVGVARLTAVGDSSPAYTATVWDRMLHRLRSLAA